MGAVDELSPANALLGDAAALRQRLARDGYVFFRGLLPGADMGAAADDVRTALRRGGWIDRRGRASAQRHALNPGDALGDPAFRAAIASPAFNRIPYLGPLRQTVRMILGPLAFSYPAKVLRAIYPERPPELTRGRYMHQDYPVSGVQDMLTTWVPLTGWATAQYRAGDALLFHCLTSHAALPNCDTVLRLSGDFRWQCPDQPAPAQLMLGPAGGQREMFSRLFAREPWWEPVPAGLTLVPREHLAASPPGPSRRQPSGCSLTDSPR